MKHTHRGISLVEVLVALAVMGTGLIAVAAFQSDLISGSGTNKARAEALALAQERIEEFQNYSAVTLDKDNPDAVIPDAATGFNTLFTDTNNAYVTENNTIAGNNAVFTRKYSISGGTGEVKFIEVRVEWADRNGEAQHVALNTQVGWENPRTAGDLGLEDVDPLVESATGRARLGDGQLPDGANTTPNDDGTKLYEDGEELKLAVDDDIVLTLEEACQIDDQNNNSCIDFVKIRGIVYIDTGSTNKIPGDVYVKASDAAYCHRYYMSNGSPVEVTANTTSALTTANGDYMYFNYTCYLGGGWHGNIGILLNGGLQQTDKVCMGDPTTDEPDDDPVINGRRIYRGMTYKIDANGDPITDPNTGTIYYSKGIGDSVELPVPGSGDATHDFVVASMATTATEGSNCISAGPMVRTDANVNGTAGDLFAGNPTEFYCLNENLSYLDSYSTPYAASVGCPYDPSDPPVAHHVVTGTVVVVGDSSIASHVSAMGVETSDGDYNCTLGTKTFSSDIYSIPYSCDVYDWGYGWTGFIQVNPNTDEISCGSLRLLHQVGVTADVNSQDFSCSAGSFVIFRGTVTTVNNRKVLASVVMDNNGGTCTVAADGMSYECRSNTFDTETWSGSLTFTATNGVICGTATQSDIVTETFSGLEAGPQTQNIQIENNSGGCPAL